MSGPVQQLHSLSASGHTDSQTLPAAQRNEPHPPDLYRRGPPRPYLAATGRQESQPVLSPAGAPLLRSPVQPQSSTLQPHGPNVRPPPLLRRVESSGFLPAPPQPRQNSPLHFQPQNWPRPPTRPQNPGQYRPHLERPEDQTNTAYIHEHHSPFAPTPPAGTTKQAENTEVKKTVTFNTTPTEGQSPSAHQNLRQPPPGIIRRQSPWALLKEKLPTEGRGLLLNQGGRPNFDFIRMQSPDQGNLQKREGDIANLNMTAGRGSSPAPGANPQSQSPPVYNGRPLSGNMTGKPGALQRPPSQEGNSPSPHPGMQRVMSGERKSPFPEMQRTDSMRHTDPRGTNLPQERMYTPNTNSPKPPLGSAKSPKPSLDDDDDVVITTGDARMSIGRGTPPMRPQSGNRSITGESPVDLSRTYTKLQPDVNRPSSGQDGHRPSSNMDGSRPPSGHEFKRPPSGHDMNRPPTSHDNSRPPTGYDNNRPPTGYDNSRPTTGHDISRPPTSHDNSRPSSGHDNSRPSTGHDNISRPPTGNDNISRPPTWHDNTRPPTGHENSRPPTGHESSRPPSGLMRSESRQSIENRIHSGADSKNEMRPASRPFSGDSQKSTVPSKPESQHTPSPSPSQKSDFQDNKSHKDSRSQSQGSLSPQGSVDKQKLEQSRTPTPNPPATTKSSQPSVEENQSESEKSSPKVSAQPSPELRKTPDAQKTPEPQKTPELQKNPEPHKTPEPQKTPEPPRSPEKQGTSEPKKSPELRKSPDRPGSKQDGSLSASNINNSVANTPNPNKSADSSRASTPYPAKSSESSANPTPSTKSAADSRNVTPLPAQNSSNNDSGTVTPGRAGEHSLINSRGETPDRSETPVERKTPAERPKSLKRSLSGKVTPDASFDHDGKRSSSGSSSRMSSAGRRSDSKSPLQRSASARLSKSGSKTPGKIAANKRKN